MRANGSAGGVRVRAIAGTRVVLLAMDCDEASRKGLMGFAVSRRRGTRAPMWLASMKVFRSIVPDPGPALRDRTRKVPPFLTDRHPIQGFLWSDYDADPDTAYVYTVVPMYEPVDDLRPGPAVRVEVRTESEDVGSHRIWFNRGAVASQAFAREFGNTGPTKAQAKDPSSRVTRWLARGLLDACLDFIDSTAPDQALRVAAYELTYQPILDAFKRALDRGVDVKIVYADESGAAASEAELALAAAGIPAKVGNRRILFPRRNAGDIPHNKFIVRLNGRRPVAVWTGSTNFTPSGFLGQTNVGHLLADAKVARTYLTYWTLLSKDPTWDDTRTGVLDLTPDPPNVVAPGSTTVLLSPRRSSDMLHWYGERIEDTATVACLTAAFGVDKRLAAHLVRPGDALRYLLLEKAPTTTLATALRTEPDVITAYGIPLGELYRMVDGQPVGRERIKEFELDKWFLREEHFRSANDGFVFFVHTKFLLVDPLSNDPLVCTGSANFSTNSLLNNDENMLLIRGDTRVADIYLTEFDRIFRHFYARDVINELEAKGTGASKPFLDETPAWSAPYFQAGWLRSRRREAFFASPDDTWVTAAASR